jgi:hypothetical protein
MPRQLRQDDGGKERREEYVRPQGDPPVFEPDSAATRVTFCNTSLRYCGAHSASIPRKLPLGAIMRLAKPILLLVVLLLGAAAMDSTFAQHRGYGGYGGGHRGHGWYGGHGHANYGFGVYLGGPWYYPAPYYYPPAVASPSYPTEYVERDSVAAAPQRADPYWYFCPESNAYFPREAMPGGWQIAPRPPADRRDGAMTPSLRFLLLCAPLTLGA